MLRKVTVYLLLLMGLFFLVNVLSGCDLFDEKASWDTGLEVGAVAASNASAVEVGQKILEEGGNAIDAAIAVAFALNVAEPHASGIAGYGDFLIFPADGEPTVICYRERAPEAAHPDIYKGDNCDLKVRGGTSVAVPSYLRGMEKALELYGTKEMEELVNPSIALARDGFPVSQTLADTLSSNLQMIFGDEMLSDIFLNEGFPYMEGEIMTYPQMGDTLSYLLENGFDEFYDGQIAEAIIEAIQANDGIMTLEDLKQHSSARVLDPVQGEFGPYTVYTANLPTCGGISMLQLLNIWERYPGEVNSSPDHMEIAYLIEAMGIGSRDRENFLGDPEFVDVDLDWLTSEEYYDEKAAEILGGEIDFDSVGEEAGSTTNFVTADKDGNVVVVTQSIHFFWGSRIAVPEWGFFLNNSMNNIRCDPDSPHATEGGKSPLSPMSPAIFVRDNEPVLAVGSPGARRIVSTVTQVALNYLIRGYTLEEAIEAPRFHSEGGRVRVDLGFPDDLKEKLEDLGYDIFENSVGSATALAWENGVPKGHTDSRRPGGVFIK